MMAITGDSALKGPKQDSPGSAVPGLPWDMGGHQILSSPEGA